MAYHRVEDGPWPVGTQVAVWPAGAVTEGEVPQGSPVYAAVASANGVAEFGGLTEGGTYTAFGHGGTQTFTATNQEARLAELEAGGGPPGPPGPPGPAATPPHVTALPGSPTDGQECYYQTPTEQLWHLRYRTAASGPYKWEYLGGAPGGIWQQSSQTGSKPANAWGPIGAGVSTVIPLAGEYLFDIRATLTNTTAACTWHLGIAINLVNPGTPPQSDVASATQTAVNQHANPTISTQKTVTTAGHQVYLRTWHTGTDPSDVAMYGYSIRYTPIRVG